MFDPENQEKQIAPSVGYGWRTVLLGLISNEGLMHAAARPEDVLPVMLLQEGALIRSPLCALHRGAKRDWTNHTAGGHPMRWPV